MRGRIPRPTALKLLEGARPCRINANEPKPPAARQARCPSWLGADAKRFWKRYRPLLKQAGILAETDHAMFEALCSTYGRCMELQRVIDEHGPTYRRDNGLEKIRPEFSALMQYNRTFLDFSRDFGMTPASRSRINATPIDDDWDDGLDDSIL